MTKEQFNKHKWGAGMEALHKQGRVSVISPVISVDFEEKTIGIELPNGDLFFAPCEEFEMIKDPHNPLKQ